MAFNGMSSVPSVTQRSLAITATQFSSFATPAITVPFPSVYGGQTQIPFTFTDTATWASTRVPTTLGGAAATAGVHSINSEASAAGYRTHDYGNSGSGGGWPTWATAVIASCGGAAVILLAIGVWCFCRRSKKRKAARRRAAAAAAAGYGQASEGKTRRKSAKNGAGYTEKPPVALQDAPRRSRKSGAVGAGRSHSLYDSDSPSRSGSRRGADPYDFPPAALSGGGADSPSHTQARSRDLAALGIARPTSASPSIRRQQEQDPALHGNAYASDGPAYPRFAQPRRSREVSAGSENGLLAPAAPFASKGGETRGTGYHTPPPRSPNTSWGEFDSPGQTGSPARLLGHDESAAYGYTDHDTPRSSLTMSTRGTGGGAYRWDRDPDLSGHMPDAEVVSAALGRAMTSDPFGTPQSARWSNQAPGSAVRGHSPQRAPALNRSTTPTYPPADQDLPTTSRTTSRQRGTGSATPSVTAPSSDGMRQLQRQSLHRSTTPDGPPVGFGLAAPISIGDRSEYDHAANGESGHRNSETRNYSRASTYATAEDDDGVDDYGAPNGAYAR